MQAMHRFVEERVSPVVLSPGDAINVHLLRLLDVHPARDEESHEIIIDGVDGKSIFLLLFRQFLEAFDGSRALERPSLEAVRSQRGLELLLNKGRAREE